MTEELKPELKKIHTISTVLLPVLYLTILSIAWMIIMVTWWVSTSPTSAGENFFIGTELSVQPDQIVAGMLTFRDKRLLMTGMAGVLLLILPGIYFAVRIILNFRKAEIFSARNVVYARRIALLFLIYIMLGSLGGLATSWVPGEGFDFSFNPLLFSKNFIILGLLWLVVWVMDIGRALQLDSDMTI